MSKTTKQKDRVMTKEENTTKLIKQNSIRKQKGSAQDKQRRKKRMKLWPEAEESSLWIPRDSGHFAQIPRMTPFYLQAIDYIIKKTSDKKLQASKTYLALLCELWNQGYIEIKNPILTARAAGFNAQRASKTWNAHMHMLKELGFIDTKEGASGKFNYVLIYHPYTIINEKYRDTIQPWLWNTIQEKENYDDDD